MRKAKSLTKTVFLGLRLKGGSKSIAVENPQGANCALEVTLVPVTAPKMVAASVLGQDSSQSKTNTIINSEDHIVETAIQPKSRPVSLSPASAVVPFVDETVGITSQKGKENISIPSRISRIMTELDGAMAEFRKNYELFAEKHSDVLLLDDEFNGIFQKAEATDDIKRSAQIFGAGIWVVLRTMETKKNVSKSGWLAKLCTFLTKMYPVAMLSLNLTASVAEVSSMATSILMLQVTSFLPLKGMAGGLCIILQVNKIYIRT